MIKRINGIVGGILSKAERAQSETQALAILQHRFGTDQEFQDLLNTNDFQLFLRRKAAKRVGREGTTSTDPPSHGE